MIDNSRTYISKEEYIKMAQSNPWLMIGGIDFEDDPFMEEDYGYQLTYVSNPDDLLKKIGHGNWAIRQAFGYGSLVFANQVNGGDEWLALKKFPDGKIISFDSITFEDMIKRGDTWTGKNVQELIVDLDKAKDKEELKKAYYPSNENQIEQENNILVEEDEEEIELEI